MNSAATLAICVHADVASPAARDTGEPAAGTDVTSAARVAAARDRARHRFRGTPWQVNADIPGSELDRSYLPPAEAVAPLRRAVDLGEISARAAHQVIRVAWTLADLAGNTRPGPQECGQALAFLSGDSPVTRPPAGVLAATSRGTTRASATLDDGLPADHRPALSRWDATLPTISSDARRDELTSRRTLRVRLSAPPTVGSAPVNGITRWSAARPTDGCGAKQT